MSGTSDPRRILVINGHPDPEPDHFVAALADAYAAGAADAHQVDRLDIARLDFPIMRSPEAWQHETPPPDIAAAQAQILAAGHIALFYPLWLGDVPALLKGFLEQVLRPGFSHAQNARGFPKPLLAGRSALVVVSMGMPALAYKVYYRAHSLKSLERNILKFCGIGPVETLVIGRVDDAGVRQAWLERVRHLGETTP